ncbi:unnamed protein product [Paramecium octaurelia]|uniref:MORN repeat protein n=1 Tax=Paramecium octaurelia TaxID=43137 RepID=A0A8S1Y5J5_PAROT|nr:unnamed protein product [Paramecium octaurelia]
MNFLNNFADDSNLHLFFSQGIPQDCLSFHYNCFQYPFTRKIQLTINFTKNHKIFYIIDGEIIRIDSIENLSIRPYILTNLDQIKYLSWIGEYGENKKKVGRWFANWDGILMADVGGYYSQEGKKIGQWKEINDNYSKNIQIYQIGQYINDQRRGIWRNISNEKDIGGGFYDEQGSKHGLWIDVSDSFCKENQLTYQGEYNNGTKVGKWKILFNNQQIGGGYFNNQGQKIGKWVDLSSGYSIEAQIKFVGEYQNGKKQGLWDVLEENIFTGGGVQDVNGLKSRKWIELSDNSNDYIHIFYIGDYINGKKYGMWETTYRYNRESNLEKICSGQFDEQGLKNGKWVELNESYNYNCQVILQGQYKHGIKIDRWNFMYRLDDDRGFTYIGEGFFDLEGQRQKQWIELWDKFEDKSQVIFKGIYQNNKKCGHWQTMFRCSCYDNFEVVGGGQYDDDGLKLGQWIELSEDFTRDFQVMHKGEYIFGQKCGCWATMKREKKNEIFRIIENKNI